MLEIGWFSAKLFFKGKLLRDPIYFIRQTAIATTTGSLILISLAQAQFALWISIVLSSLLTGIIMPFLLKDFKTK